MSLFRSFLLDDPMPREFFSDLLFGVQMSGAVEAELGRSWVGALINFLPKDSLFYLPQRVNP